PVHHAAALALAALAAALAALALGAGPASAVPLPAGSTALLSGQPSLLDAYPVPVSTADIRPEAVSQTGRYVAFTSDSDGLVAGDDDRVPNVYRKDMTTGEVLLVSRGNGANGEPSHAECDEATISDDGLRVAFSCDGPLDAELDKNDRTDVYVRTLRTPGAPETTLVSRASGLGVIGNHNSYTPVISGNGEYVAFATNASNLIPGATGNRNVYRRHLGGMLTTVLVSRRNTGVESQGADPSISNDGQLVAFETGDRGETADDNNAYDVYLRDVDAGTTKLVSRIGADGKVANAGSANPMISGNGLAIVFESTATNLDTRDKDIGINIYRRSLGFQTTSVIDVNAADVTSGRSWGASIDDSSHVIAFVSEATALDGADKDASADVYVRNIAANSVQVASRASGAAGAIANRDATSAAMSGDAYHAASDLEVGGVTPDSDPRRESVILRDLDKQVTRSVSRPAGDDPFVNAGGDATAAKLSADGRLAVFEADAPALGLPGSSGDGIFLRDRTTGAVTLVSRADGPGGAPLLRVSDPAISADGRRVAFSGRETADDVSQLWVRDLAEGRTRLASRADGANGTPGNGRSRGAALDADGTRVVFRSRATNLGDDPDAGDDIHVRDLETDETILVSRADGAAGPKGDGESNGADVDASGTRVAFGTYAKNLGDGDTNATRDIHIRDLAAGTTRLVSATPAGVLADNDSEGDPSIDASGTKVAFDSYATNLGDATATSKVLVRDLAGGTLDVLGLGEYAVISPDGDHVAFNDAANRVQLRDLALAQTVLVSRRAGLDGASATKAAHVGDVSAQAACVTFGTADSLVGTPRDSYDSYLRAVTADCGDGAPAGDGGPGTDGPGGPVGSDGPDAGPRDALA
ncbi:MAG TPA: hypothetical protein VGW10_05905, partial [Solirubrobacteraceae bacterium]|nr:hypothetical protein [Solirubrobacteraceae bacterium]